MEKDDNKMSPPILQLSGIGKKYGPVQVLYDIDFDLQPGEVHALVGENGAGKSTLSKIISGVTRKTYGSMQLENQAYDPENTRDAISNGISIVHQEFNLIPVLSVIANIYLGKEQTTYGVLKDKAKYEEAGQLLKRLGLNVPLEKKVSELSVSQQQMLEIAKCLADKSRIIIMDEPTATLTLNETKQLFEVIDSLRRDGISFIYISHKMSEIFTVSQRVTVLRDGRKIGTYNTNELDEDKLVGLMVGRQITSMYNHESNSVDKTVLTVRHLTKKGLAHDISFSLKEGEVLGFGGLVGAGRSEVMKMIFGSMPFEEGEIELFGEKIASPRIKDMISKGLIYLTEDRKGEGLILNKPISENISLSIVQKIMNGLVIDRKKEKSIAENAVQELSIKSNGIKQHTGNLSGGNQQKVVLAKWLATDPKVLILDEPTRGIDVGAKHEIYQIINNLSKSGKSIIMISSEMPELIGMCDRVCVMSEGRITGELKGDEITEENIMNYAVQRGYDLKRG